MLKTITFRYDSKCKMGGWGNGGKDHDVLQRTNTKTITIPYPICIFHRKPIRSPFPAMIFLL